MTYPSRLAVLAVTLLMVGSINAQDHVQRDPSQVIEVPAFEHAVAPKPVIEAAYRFAAEHPEILRYMPCYCSCGTTLGHVSNESCFITSRHENSVEWNDHSATCKTCLAVAINAKAMFEQGADVSIIRDNIDRIYSAIAAHRTQTPEPPPHK